MNRKMILNRNVLFSCILLFSIGFEMGGFQTVLRTMAEEFSLGSLGIGFLVSAQYVGIILMPVLFGGIADRVGKKRILLCFMLVFSLGTLLVGVSSQLVLTVAGFLAIGSGYSVAESVSTALLGEYFHENADRYINLSQASLCIGAVTAPLVCSFPGFNWRLLFIVSCVLCLASFVVLVSDTDFLETKNYARNQLFDRSIFHFIPFTLLFTTMLIYVGLENGFGYFAETYFHESFQSAWGAYAISLYWGAMALSRLISSILSGSLYVQLKYRFIAIAIVFVALWTSSSPQFSLILCVLIGFCYGPIWSFIMALVVNRFPEKTASATGLISSGCGLGGVLFPVLMRSVPEGSGFLFLACSSVAACICIVLASRQSMVA